MDKYMGNRQKNLRYLVNRLTGQKYLGAIFE